MHNKGNKHPYYSWDLWDQLVLVTDDRIWKKIWWLTYDVMRHRCFLKWFIRLFQRPSRIYWSWKYWATKVDKFVKCLVWPIKSIKLGVILQVEGCCSWKYSLTMKGKGKRKKSLKREILTLATCADTSIVSKTRQEMWVRFRKPPNF